MRWPTICLGLSLCVFGCRPSDPPAQTERATSPPKAVPTAPGEILFPDLTEEPDLAEIDEGLNLPDHFRQRVQDRAYLDQVAVKFHRLEPQPPPAAQQYPPQTRFVPNSIRVVRDQPPAEHLAHWRELPEDFRPLRGFRAPVSGQGEFWPARLSEDEGAVELAQVVEENLAEEGLMSTLARAIDALGAERCREDPARAVRELRRIGFPTDLLQFFSRTEQAEPMEGFQTVKEVAEQILKRERLELVACELSTALFRYQRSDHGFQAADESGGIELGLLRMQMGGGYQDGVVPGGALDIMSQLAHVLPEIDYLISVPSEFAADFRRMVRDFWPLTRAGQVTIVIEPLVLASWAQDNGKAGSLRDGAWATLVPRYATQDEVSFRFLPGESLLAHGLTTAGHAVRQSPLLFQGGNLLVVRDPVRGERVLLVGEAEIHRNRALGLTEPQVQRAFEVEFGVDRCVVLPPASFHIDYDVSVRHHRGRVIAFVNDSLSAARLVFSRGLTALQEHGLFDSTQAAAVRENLAADNWQGAYRAVSNRILPLRNTQGEYSSDLVHAFAADASDSAAANFRCFLTALDLLASRAWSEESCPGPPAYKRYIGALRRLQDGAQAQRERLEKMGWAVASVPSMPDLEASVNYLNGIHDRQRYLMPIHGAFYQSLDQIAIEVFRGVLGSSVQIIPVRSAGAQGRHGAVHCTAAAYPKLAQ